MPTVRRARSTEEYIEMVRQAVFEVDDLRACLEWDYDSDAMQIARAVPYLEPLGEQVKALQQSMLEGNYDFATGNLPFMQILSSYPDQLPFAQLLESINATHCHGLDVD